MRGERETAEARGLAAIRAALEAEYARRAGERAILRAIAEAEHRARRMAEDLAEISEAEAAEAARARRRSERFAAIAEGRLTVVRPARPRRRRGRPAGGGTHRTVRGPGVSDPPAGDGGEARDGEGYLIARRVAWFPSEAESREARMLAVLATLRAGGRTPRIIPGGSGRPEAAAADAAAARRRLAAAKAERDRSLRLARWHRAAVAAGSLAREAAHTRMASETGRESRGEAPAGEAPGGAGKADA